MCNRLKKATNFCKIRHSQSFAEVFYFSPLPYFYIMLLSSVSSLPLPAVRIISLVPSQTELLYDLGAGEQVVGITKYCIHPEHWLKEKVIIGGTKTIDAGLIDSLQPDLIIANKEENVKAQVDELAARYPVWVSDVHTLNDALDMITDLGKLTGKAGNASRLTATICQAFQQTAPPPVSIPAAYLIWRKPYMTVGGDTFIHDMLGRMGLQNLFADHQRYPACTINQLRDMHCPLVLLSSEPFPFREKHIAELQELLPDVHVLLVDGEMFSWYGSRLIKAVDYFRVLRSRIDQLRSSP